MKKYSFVFLVTILFACNNSNDSSGKGGDSAKASSPVKKEDGSSGCSTFFWFKKGAVMEYAMTDGKGKTIAHTITTIEDVHQDGAALVADYSTSYNDNKNIKASYRCEGDKLYMNMKSLFNNEQFQRSGMEMEVKDAYISFPWQMKEGDNLEDAAFEIKAKRQGKDFMTMRSVVNHRKVDAMEKVTTPAGTWDCMKLTETRTTTTEMMGKQVSSNDTKSVQWFAPAAGLVKFESYDPAGNVTSRSELVSIKE
jgi:hypothetical protein